MEEERARQEAAAKKAAEDAANQEKGGEQQASSQDATMSERASAATSEAENKTSDLMVGVFFCITYWCNCMHSSLLNWNIIICVLIIVGSWFTWLGYL